MSKHWEWTVNPETNSWELCENDDYDNPLIGTIADDLNEGHDVIFVTEEIRERTERVPQLEEQNAELVASLRKILFYSKHRLDVDSQNRIVLRVSKEDFNNANALARVED